MQYIETKDGKVIMFKATEPVEPTHNHKHDDGVSMKDEVIRNSIDEKTEALISAQQLKLQNAVQDIELRICNTVIDKILVTKNTFESEDNIISKKDTKEYTKELELAIATFYTIIIPLYAGIILNRRAKEFGQFTDFKVNSEVKKYIKQISSAASTSHVSTILGDLLSTIQQTYEENISAYLEAIEKTGRKVTDADLTAARMDALKGKSQASIVKSIRDEYNGSISKIRAKAIARTETNRAFTQAQYNADKQFIKQNGYEGRAYKKWITTNSNPCPVCLDLASQPPIPFATNFADIGDELTVTYEDKGVMKIKKMTVDFEDLTAGNAHVNCGCKYQLILE